MCGILFGLHESRGGHEPSVDERVGEQRRREADGISIVPAWMSRRGPDAQGSYIVRSHGDGLTHDMVFAGSVLHLRGDDASEAIGALPLRSMGTVLCFNGEIYSGLAIESDKNDSIALLNALRAATEDDASRVPKLISQLRGPFAFVFYDVRFYSIWMDAHCITIANGRWRRK